MQYVFACVYCKESLVWFEASGFGYTVYIGLSLRRLSVILLLPFIMEILQL